MRFQFVGRVIGHELVEADKPKSDADRMKVKLTLFPVQDTPGTPGRATFTMPTDIASRDFPLRRTLTLTCEECQYELFAAMSSGEEKPARPKASGQDQTEIGLPVGDSPIATPPERQATVTPIGAARGPRRRGRRGAETVQ